MQFSGTQLQRTRWLLFIFTIGGILFVTATPGSITYDPTPVTLKVAVTNNLPVTLAQINRFTAKYPQVTIQQIELPVSTSDLVDYLTSKYFSTKSSDLDLFATDVIYPGQLESYCLDLLQYNLTDVAAQFNDGVIQNNMAKGKLVALPLNTGYGLLFYRLDLLAKYGFMSPPTTYAQLANMTEIILKGEHGSGINPNLQGYSFQGTAYEGLTCNVMEWLGSFQGGKVVDLDANGNVEVTINNPNAIAGLDKFASWIGSIAPVTAIDAKEDESLALFTAGNAIFMRHWPSIFPQLDKFPALHGKYAATYPPSLVDGKQGYSTSGGWGLSVNKYSPHPEWTVELIKHMLSPDEMFIRGRDAGQIPPVKAGVIPNAGDMCNRTIPSWCDVPSPNIISRPSTLSAPHYGDLSQLIYRGMTDVLLGRYNATKLVSDLECSIGSLLNINIPRCLPDAIMIYSQPDVVTQSLVGTSAVLMAFIVVVFLLTLIFREDRVMKASSPTFLYVMLFGALMSASVVIPMVTYEPTTHTCRVQIWLAHMGFILLFGALFLKTYRLQAIFGDTQFKSVHISDVQLLGKQGLLCLAVAVYLMVWTIVDSPKPTMVIDSNTGYLVCKSTTSFWPNLILLAEGLFIGYGIYLCLAVRSIPNLFNESQFIGIAIYNVGALGSIILLITKIALTEYNKAVLFETVGVLVVITVTVSVIFIPKFLLILSDIVLQAGPDMSSLSTITSTPIDTRDPSVHPISPLSKGLTPPPPLGHGRHVLQRGVVPLPYAEGTIKPQGNRLTDQTQKTKDIQLHVLNSTASATPSIQFATIKTTITQLEDEIFELRRLVRALGGAASLPVTTDVASTLASLSRLEVELAVGHGRLHRQSMDDHTVETALPSPTSAELLICESSEPPQLNPKPSTSPPTPPSPSSSSSSITSANGDGGSGSGSRHQIRIHIAQGTSFPPILTQPSNDLPPVTVLPPVTSLTSDDHVVVDVAQSVNSARELNS